MDLLRQRVDASGQLLHVFRESSVGLQEFCQPVGLACGGGLPLRDGVGNVLTMLRIRIGYPPPQVEARLLIGDGGERQRAVTQAIDPAQLVALQREADRVEFDSSLANYLQAIVTASRSSPALSLGASPRAGINLARAARARALLHGRGYCIADDVHDLAVPVLAHRIRLAAHAEGYTPSRDEAETAIRDLVARIPVPL